MRYEAPIIGGEFTRAYRKGQFSLREIERDNPFIARTSLFSGQARILLAVIASGSLGAYAGDIVYLKAQQQYENAVANFRAGDPQWRKPVMAGNSDNYLASLNVIGDEWIQVRSLESRSAKDIIGWTHNGSVNPVKFIGPQYAFYGAYNDDLVVENGNEKPDYFVWFMGEFEVFKKIGSAYVPVPGMVKGFVPGRDVVVTENTALLIAE